MDTPQAQRTEPSFDAGERAMLDGWLDYHRATLLWKCEGLADEQLRRRSVPPSRLSLLGLVRHPAPHQLAVDLHPHDRGVCGHNGHADLLRECIDGTTGH